MSSAGGVFVDRDGVVNQLVPDPISGLPESPLRIEDVRLVSGAAAALGQVARSERRLIGVSNQPAAAKGVVSPAQLQAVQDRVLGLLAADGVRFDGFWICRHHPLGVVPELTGHCDCRKPAPGMLLSAADELSIDLAASWMIGDTDSDVLAGRAAGCSTVLVEYPGSAHKRGGVVRPDAWASDLIAAVGLVLGVKRVH